MIAKADLMKLREVIGGVELRYFYMFYAEA
jgi:hypothetical protein